MKKALVISSKGIGDGLLMMIAAHHLRTAGYTVSFFHPCLQELSPWFPRINFCSKIGDFSSYDLIIAQNDNKPPFPEYRKLRAQKKIANLSLFYPEYSFEKHGPLDPLDRVFDRRLPMAENIAKASSSLLRTPYSKNNGVTPPPGLHRKKYPNRVLLHPTSLTCKLQWKKERFITLAKVLRSQGYEIGFLVSPQEKPSWNDMEKLGYKVPVLATLSDLAAYIYESGALIGHDSGPGHLASCLDIPTLILAGNRKHLQLWRPGWLLGQVLLPPSYVPNIKHLRIQDHHWPWFISVSRVVKAFEKLKMLAH